MPRRVERVVRTPPARPVVRRERSPEEGPAKDGTDRPGRPGKLPRRPDERRIDEYVK